MHTHLKQKVKAAARALNGTHERADKVGGGEGGRASVLCRALDVGKFRVVAAAQDPEAVVQRG
jgi:hypothetical protein